MYDGGTRAALYIVGAMTGVLVFLFAGSAVVQAETSIDGEWVSYVLGFLGLVFGIGLVRLVMGRDY